VPVTPMVVVPVEVEAGFYRLNNLPDRLQALFRDVDLDDPDEDDIEELAPAAEALVRGHALLAEVIEALFAQFDTLPPTVAVRRSGTEGVRTARGAPTLWAVKRCWAAEWRDEELARRLTTGLGLAPDPRPLAIHDGEVREVGVDALGHPPGVARAWADASGRLARVELAAA
jgi:hypothetical protein